MTEPELREYYLRIEFLFALGTQNTSHLFDNPFMVPFDILHYYNIEKIDTHLNFFFFFCVSKQVLQNVEGNYSFKLNWTASQPLDKSPPHSGEML